MFTIKTIVNIVNFVTYVVQLVTIVDSSLVTTVTIATLITIVISQAECVHGYYSKSANNNFTCQGGQWEPSLDNHCLYSKWCP